jgi:hypothetical protein
VKRLVLLILLALSASVVAPAQAQPKQQPLNRREQIKKRIRIMRANELTEELALDEPTAGKLFPLLARYDDELDKLLEKKVQIARLLEGASGDAKAIDRVIDDAIANQRALWSSEERRLGEIRKILTAGQVAKLLIVLPALERKIQNQLRRAIENANAKQLDDDVEPDERPTRRPQPRQAPPPQRISPPGCDPFSSKDCH